LDGEEVDFLNVNTMYSGVFVPTGTHTLRLEYRTPHLIEGMLLSTFGICSFLGIIIYHKKKNKKNKNNI
jgi:uncharacterized membrane protein YfhO